jgi:hypothetical protein
MRYIGCEPPFTLALNMILRGIDRGCAMMIADRYHTLKFGAVVLETVVISFELT